MVGDELPFDCILLILGYLEGIDLINISSTSKNWGLSVASRSDRIWEEKYQIRIKHSRLSDEKSLPKKLKKKKSFFEKYMLLRSLEKVYFRSLFPGGRILSFARWVTLSLKLVVVGDINVGKTSMLISYANNDFPDDYVPTVFDNCNATVLFDNFHVSLSLWDTDEREDYDKLRIMAYPETDVVLICFSLMDPESLENVRTRWAKEVREYCPNVPIVLCGNKLDEKEDTQIMCELQKRDSKPATRNEGEKVAKEIDAVGYYENSAKTQKGLKEVFQVAISSGLKGSPRTSLARRKKGDDKKCEIM